mmetsp:Transcript_3383/g.10633  ORF Transcript_3383/g.10633 Transcript_3383/m.10633 type:complete len:205 (+) Transcript_3383:1819-2433(+)
MASRSCCIVRTWSRCACTSIVAFGAMMSGTSYVVAWNASQMRCSLDWMAVERNMTMKITLRCGRPLSGSRTATSSAANRTNAFPRVVRNTMRSKRRRSAAGSTPMMYVNRMRPSPPAPAPAPVRGCPSAASSSSTSCTSCANVIACSSTHSSSLFSLYCRVRSRRYPFRSCTSRSYLRSVPSSSSNTASGVASFVGSRRCRNSS